MTQAGHFGDPPLDNRRVRATYRLQLRSGVGFREATAAVPYLERLGVSHLYASPLLEARAGSTHGYDVIDPTRLDPALGTKADFDALCAALHDAGLGLVLDIVPNHMAASLESPWWRDLLTHGRDSAFAAVFDVDWEAPGLDGRLLVPVLDIPLEQALAAGDVTVDPPVVRLANGLELPMRPGTHRLDEQAYLLAHWRDANARVDYRRFFDIPDLVGVRVDDPSVFELTHALVLDLVRDGCVQGLRVDHVDGLRDPLGYLRRLRDAVGPDVPIWVEKSRLPPRSGFRTHFPPTLPRTHSFRRCGFIARGSKNFWQLAQPYAMVGVNVIAAESDAEARRLFASAQQSFANLVRGTRGRLLPPMMISSRIGLRWRRHTRRKCCRVRLSGRQKLSAAG